MPNITARKGPNLRTLKFSPDTNPLVSGHDITVRKKHVRTGLRKDLADTQTGEIEAASIIHTIEELDDAQFVKVFGAGIKAIYDLSRTASRVFQVILDFYQREPMSGGFADTVYLAWINGGINGQEIGMSEDTFRRGLKELLQKSFLAPRTPNLFWVNPTLLFKGDRALFLREYRRKQSSLPKAKPEQEQLEATEQEQLEAAGQQRLVE